MTDRINGFLVHLDKEYRVGDKTTGADRIRKTLEMVKGVAEVTEIPPEDFNVAIARSRIKRELVQKLYEALD